MQVYIYGKGFLIQSKEINIKNLIQTIANTVNLLNERVSDQLQRVFKTALECADTPGDKQLIKGLMAKLTIVSPL